MPSAADALLMRLWPLLTEGHLREIARRPRVGDAEQHHQSLLTFRRRGLPPGDDPAVWTVHPSEALEITRWDDPGRPRRSGPSERDRHLLRLFSTAALIHAEGHGRFHVSPEETAARLRESAEVFGEAFVQEAESLIRWARTSEED